MYRLGLIPSVDPETMIREAVPFAECLGTAIGLDVETIVIKLFFYFCIEWLFTLRITFRSVDLC